MGVLSPWGWGRTTAGWVPSRTPTLWDPARAPAREGGVLPRTRVGPGQQGMAIGYWSRRLPVSGSNLGRQF